MEPDTERKRSGREPETEPKERRSAPDQDHYLSRNCHQRRQKAADSLSGSRVEVCTFSGSGGGIIHLFRRSLAAEMSENRIRARANYLLFVLQIVRQNQLIFSQAGSVSARIGAEARSKTRKKTNDQRQRRRKGRRSGSDSEEPARSRK